MSTFEMWYRLWWLLEGPRVRRALDAHLREMLSDAS